MGLGISSNSVITSLPQTFTCITDGNNIFQIDLYGNKQVIGVAKKSYDELEKISNEYYQKLVELGVIVPEKSPEDIQKEMLDGMTTMLAEIKSLKQEVEVLKNDQSTGNSANAAYEPRGYKQAGTGVDDGAECGHEGAEQK